MVGLVWTDLCVDPEVILPSLKCKFFGSFASRRLSVHVCTPPIVGRHGIIFRNVGCGAVAAAINGRPLSNGVELRRIRRRRQRGSDQALFDLWTHPVAGETSIYHNRVET